MDDLNKNLQIPEPYLSFLEAVDRVPEIWAQHALEDLPDAPQFDRKIVVSGFNVPKNTDTIKDRIYITVEQLWTLKDSGKMFTKKDAPMWEISDNTWSYLRDFTDPSRLVEVDKIEPDPETGEPVRSKSFVRLYTTKYLRFLLLNRQSHLVDLFEQYLKDFAIAKKDELDKI